MICYKAADNRETPNLMTRFREEVYAKKHKVPRGNHQGDPYVASAGSASWSEERRALRSEYFKKKSKGQTSRAQKRLLDAR